jgi:hypothetical protein
MLPIKSYFKILKTYPLDTLWNYKFKFQVWCPSYMWNLLCQCKQMTLWHEKRTRYAHIDSQFGLCTCFSIWNYYLSPPQVILKIWPSCHTLCTQLHGMTHIPFKGNLYSIKKKQSLLFKNTINWDKTHFPVYPL